MPAEENCLSLDERIANYVLASRANPEFVRRDIRAIYGDPSIVKSLTQMTAIDLGPRCDARIVAFLAALKEEVRLQDEHMATIQVRLDRITECLLADTPPDALGGESDTPPPKPAAVSPPKPSRSHKKAK